MLYFLPVPLAAKQLWAEGGQRRQAEEGGEFPTYLFLGGGGREGGVDARIMKEVVW